MTDSEIVRVIAEACGREETHQWCIWEDNRSFNIPEAIHDTEEEAIEALKELSDYNNFEGTIQHRHQFKGFKPLTDMNHAMEAAGLICDKHELEFFIARLPGDKCGVVIKPFSFGEVPWDNAVRDENPARAICLALVAVIES